MFAARMTPIIPTDFLQRLIAIGAAQTFSSLSEFFDKYPPDRFGHIMRQSSEFWRNAVRPLSDFELESLVRTLTIAERDFPAFGGGSVSGVIFAFHQLQERTQSSLDELADWVLAHTNNPYVPFGTSNHSARSLSELRAFKKAAAAAKVTRAHVEEERHAAAVARNAEKATHDIFAAIRRKDAKAVQALLLRGARLDAPDETGKTAMAYAQALGHASIIELLQAHANGVRPNA